MNSRDTTGRPFAIVPLSILLTASALVIGVLAVIVWHMTRPPVVEARKPRLLEEPQLLGTFPVLIDEAYQFADEAIRFEGQDGEFEELFVRSNDGIAYFEWETAPRLNARVELIPSDSVDVFVETAVLGGLDHRTALTQYYKVVHGDTLRSSWLFHLTGRPLPPENVGFKVKGWSAERMVRDAMEQHHGRWGFRFVRDLFGGKTPSPVGLLSEPLRELVGGHLAAIPPPAAQQAVLLVQDSGGELWGMEFQFAELKEN